MQTIKRNEYEQEINYYDDARPRHNGGAGTDKDSNCHWLFTAGTGTIGNVVDTVQAGRFAFTLPVEELTEGFLGLMGEGCPNFNLTLFLRPGVTVKLTGNDCFYPLWKVESPLSEQQTQSRITEYCRDVVTELMQMDLDKKPWEEREIVEMKWMKQRMDILPSLPVDAATIRALWGISMTAKGATGRDSQLCLSTTTFAGG